MSKPTIQLEFRRRPDNVAVLLPHAPPADSAQQPAEPKSPPPPVSDPATTSAPAAVAPEADNAERIQEQLEYLQNLLNDVGRAVEDLQDQHRNTTTEMQETAVELAVVAASWLTRAAIDADEFAVDDLVREMVAHLQHEKPVRIFMNRDDANLLMSLKESSSDTPEFSNADIEFVTNDELQRGAIRAESDRTTLITDLDGRLAEIRQLWMENLNETQTERRADESTGRKLKRFPDRRHSA